MTQPFEPVAFTDSPPPPLACQLTSCPLVVTATGLPPTATATCEGTNERSMRTSPPRDTDAVFADAAMGAPQWAPQHHEDTASGNAAAPVEIVARGGEARASASRIATTRAP